MTPLDEMALRAKLITPNWERLYHIYDALDGGVSVDSLAGWTGVDPWFRTQIQELVELEQRLRGTALATIPDSLGPLLIHRFQTLTFGHLKGREDQFAGAELLAYRGLLRRTHRQRTQENSIRRADRFQGFLTGKLAISDKAELVRPGKLSQALPIRNRHGRVARVAAEVHAQRH